LGFFPSSFNKGLEIEPRLPKDCISEFLCSAEAVAEAVIPVQNVLPASVPASHHLWGAARATKKLGLPLVPWAFPCS